MWPTVVLQTKEVINQVGYSNQFSLFCFHYKKARQATKGRGAADMPSETPSIIHPTCHGNQVFVAVPTPGVCPCFTGLLCHQFWIAMFQGPASRWRHPPFPTWPPASEYLWAFPNEPIHLCLVTIQTNMSVLWMGGNIFKTFRSFKALGYLCWANKYPADLTKKNPKLPKTQNKPQKKPHQKKKRGKENVHMQSVMPPIFDIFG